MAIQRRQAAPPPQAEGINFGDMGMYVQGGGMPEGDYALEFNVLNFQAVTQQGVNRGAPRLGVQVVAHSLTQPDEKPREQFYSMGSNADKSFAPDPDTGKGLVAVPGGPGTTLNNQTNWAIFLKSLYDSGLPQGIFTNDLSVLDGVHVHLANIPEPVERASFQSKTGEAAEERKPGVIAVVTEIKDGGAPWDGGGGIPEAGAPAPKAKAVAAKPAVRAAVKPKAAPVAAPAEEEAVDEEAVQDAALNAVTDLIEKSPDGITKLMLRTGTFKHVTASLSGDMAQAVIDTYFGNDAALNTILGQLGYVVKGATVVPVG